MRSLYLKKDVGTGIHKVLWEERHLVYVRAKSRMWRKFWKDFLEELAFE